MRRAIRSCPSRIAVAVVVVLLAAELKAGDSPPSPATIVRAVDLDLQEAQTIALADGTKVRVKLLGLDETRDAMRDAVRQARVKVEVNDRVNLYVAVKLKVWVDVEVLVEVHHQGTTTPGAMFYTS